MDIREKLVEHFNDDLLFADSFDDAIVGVAVGNDSGRVVYDAEQMVDILVQKENMSREEALEFLEFNTFCAYVGERTPIYVNIERSKRDVVKIEYDWSGGY
tara:strand:- start:55 stop:357 length:303 start_codon:yes stop_codon:yes gene_type:complete